MLQTYVFYKKVTQRYF